MLHYNICCASRTASICVSAHAQMASTRSIRVRPISGRASGSVDRVRIPAALARHAKTAAQNSGAEQPSSRDLMSRENLIWLAAQILAGDPALLAVVGADVPPGMAVGLARAVLQRHLRAGLEPVDHALVQAMARSQSDQT